MTQISAPTLEGGAQILKAYSNARKLFQVGNEPIGVMTYGLGNIGNRSIEGLVLDFSRNAPPGSVDELSRGLFDHVKSQYDGVFGEVPPEVKPVLGFYIAGYTGEEPFPEEFEFSSHVTTALFGLATLRDSGRAGEESMRLSQGSTKDSIPT